MRILALIVLVAGCDSADGGSVDDLNGTADTSGGGGDAVAGGDSSAFQLDGNADDVTKLTDADGGCGPNLTGTVRDFKDDHPDFEKYTGDGEKGLVDVNLGADSKPVFIKTGAGMVTSKATFDQWFRNVPDVNIASSFKITPVKGAGGLSTFDDADFFPIDGSGFGNQGRVHNFHFTSSCTQSSSTAAARSSRSAATTTCGRSSTASWRSISAGRTRRRPAPSTSTCARRSSGS